MLTDVQPLSMKAKLRALRRVYSVPLAGETFYVRALTIAELQKLDELDVEGEEPKERMLRRGKALIAASACNELGATVFTGHDDPDFSEIPTDTLKDLSEAAAERNGLTGSGND